MHEIKKVKLPDNFQVISDYMFSNCNIKKISLPEGLTAIGRNAFENNTGLKSIVIPEKVSYIGEYALSGCEKLEKVSLPDEMTSGSSLDELKDYIEKVCESDIDEYFKLCDILYDKDVQTDFYCWMKNLGLESRVEHLAI